MCYRSESGNLRRLHRIIRPFRLCPDHAFTDGPRGASNPSDEERALRESTRERATWRTDSFESDVNRILTYQERVHRPSNRSAAAHPIGSACPSRRDRTVRTRLSADDARMRDVCRCIPGYALLISLMRRATWRARAPTLTLEILICTPRAICCVWRSRCVQIRNVRSGPDAS